MRLLARPRIARRLIGVQVDGTEHELEPGDVTLVMSPLPGYQVEASWGRAVL